MSSEAPIDGGEDTATATFSSSSSAVGIDSPKRKPTIGKHLTEIYDVDHEHPLGSGAFSTVYRCTNRKTGEVLALKQIDTRRGPDSSPRNIAHEIAMMKMAGKHPNIMGCFICQLEGPFVNIVVDLFLGADLIDGLNAHTKARGPIPDAQLAHITRQMVAAIRHINKLRIVHRDVKGENFLSSMPDIGNPECRIALADFGSAFRLDAGKKLSEKVGTPAFWAPEVFAGEYDHLVDMWALGVTVCILLASTLPFQGEEAICRSPGPLLKLPLRTSSPCSHFIKACLAHDPRVRLRAEQAAEHFWLTTVQSPSQHMKQTSLRYGGALFDFSTRLVTGICSCCLDVVTSGVMEVLNPSSAQAKNAPAEPPEDNKTVQL